MAFSNFSWYTTPFFIRNDTDFNGLVDALEEKCIYVSKDYVDVLGKTFPKHPDTRWLYGESPDDLDELAELLRPHVDTQQTPHMYALDVSTHQGRLVGGWSSKIVFHVNSAEVWQAPLHELLFY